MDGCVEAMRELACRHSKERHERAILISQRRLSYSRAELDEKRVHTGRANVFDLDVAKLESQAPKFLDKRLIAT